MMADEKLGRLEIQFSTVEHSYILQNERNTFEGTKHYIDTYSYFKHKPFDCDQWVS